jgi:hypothetical protein
MFSRAFSTVLLAVSLSSTLSAQQRVHPSPNAQSESAIAVNPTNPNNLISVAMTGNDDATLLRRVGRGGYISAETFAAVSVNAKGSCRI